MVSLLFWKFSLRSCFQPPLLPRRPPQRLLQPCRRLLHRNGIKYVLLLFCVLVSCLVVALYERSRALLLSDKPYIFKVVLGYFEALSISNFDLWVFHFRPSQSLQILFFINYRKFFLLKAWSALSRMFPGSTLCSSHW